jgi:hypothetical protein
LNLETIMKLEEIRSIAKSHSIKTGHLPKAALIKAIQTGEGNFDCFATAYSGECDQANCIWREDCFEAAHKEGELS